jgi:hypothetical protein
MKPNPKAQRFGDLKYKKSMIVIVIAILIIMMMIMMMIIEASILRFKIRILRYDTIQRLIDTNLMIQYNSKTNKYKYALFVYGEGICTNP